MRALLVSPAVSTQCGSFHGMRTLKFIMSASWHCESHVDQRYGVGQPVGYPGVSVVQQPRRGLPPEQLWRGGLAARGRFGAQPEIGG